MNLKPYFRDQSFAKFSRLASFFVLAMVLFSSRTFSRCAGSCPIFTPSNPACILTKAAVGTTLENPANLTEVSRTSNSLFSFDFVHDGNSGIFTVTSQGDSDDNPFTVAEGTCSGKVTIGFSKPGQKNVRVQVTQFLSGVQVTSPNAAVVVFDNVAPVLTVNTITLGSSTDGAIGEPFSAAKTYFVSNSNLVVTGRVADPAPSQDPDLLGVRVLEGPNLGTDFFPVTRGTNGSFTADLNMTNVDDGEFVIRLAGIDTNEPSFLFSDNSKANTGDALAIKVVKDTSQPVVSKIEVIKGAGENQKTEEVPGVFVRGGEQIRVRMSFSEPMAEAPVLLMQHKGPTGEEVDTEAYAVPLDSALFASNPSEAVYVFTPLFDVNNLGGVDFLVGAAGGQGQGAGAVGKDRAGNDIDLTKSPGGGTVERAIIVDGVGPSLVRLPQDGAATDGLIQSDPANNEILAKQNFPRDIKIYVKDYNIPANAPNFADTPEALLAEDNGSGVNFDKLAGANDASQGKIRVTLTGPGGQVIPGTLATQPPNGLLYLLSSVEKLFPPTGTPLKGNYTVKVDLVDNVGNTSTEAFTFSLDIDAVNPASIQVSLLPEKTNSTGGTAGGVNLSLKAPIGGREVPDSPGQVDLATLDAVNQVDSFNLCSTDPAFDLTGSTVALKARLNGPDTVAREMFTNCTPNLADAENTCGAAGQISCEIDATRAKEVFPNLDFDFPNPGDIGQFVAPGDRDPRFGQYDGPYQVEVIAKDEPGNISNPIRKEFLLDTTPPYTEITFPVRFGKINTPLRHVSAVVVDPSPPRLHTFEQDGKVNFGSGVSISSSKMRLFLQEPYQTSLNSSIFKPDGEIRGALDFIHNPNAFDPNLPTFNPKDDSYRVLLEFTDAQANTISLPVDGSADGIYRIEVVPVDNAGNAQFNGQAPSPAGATGGFRAPEAEGETPKELVRDFFFLLDTVPPSVKLNPLPGQTAEPSEISVSGQGFTLKGKARDLSAQPGAEALKGGSGMSRVEYSLVLMTIDGEIVPEVPGTETVNGNVINFTRSNPILKNLTAVLEPILDNSNDPAVSSTRPMVPSSYKALELEEREFTISGTLPAQSRIIRPPSGGKPANYVLIVKGYDMAGNVSERRLVVNLNQTELPGPELVSPAKDQSVKSPAITFEWKETDGAADYILSVSDPDLKTTTYAVIKGNDTTNVKWNVVLTKQGRYEWKVTSRDAVGNLGIASSIQIFYYDKEAPRVASMSWSDLSPEASTQLGIGTFRLQVTFNEDIKDGPEVTFDPISISVLPQVIVTQRLEGRIWEGRATIPTTATHEWDGKATIEIKNARDMAGNSMIVDRDYDFVIDTGPSYSVRYFENPVYQKEITMVVKASEALLNAPVLTELQLISSNQASMLKITDMVYGAPLKITASQSGTAKARISASDLDGNTASRIVTFPLTVMSSMNGGTVTASFLRVNYTTKTVSEDLSLAILPRPDASAPTESGILASVGRVATGAETGSELELVQELELLVPTGYRLNQATADIRMSSALAPRHGVFVNAGGELLLLQGSYQDLWYSVQLPATGQLGIYKDEKSPEIELDRALEQDGIASSNPRIVFKAQDLGAGIRQESLRVILSGQELAFEEQNGDEYVYRMQGRPVHGDNELSIEVEDRFGNRSVLQSVLQVLGPIRMHAVSYPNPARSFSTLRYDLSRSASEVRIRLYDAAGSLVYNTSSNQDVSVSTQKGLNTFRWDLVNRRGGYVANGVYFATVEARDSDGNEDRQRLKIAVLQ